MALELSNSPFPYLHEWTESDMHTFDQWARRVAAGDIWSRDVGIPFHQWHRDVAADYAQRYPDRWQALLSENHDNTDNAIRGLWQRWCGGGRLFQEPLYPYLVALVYRISGPDVLPVFGMQMLLGAACVGLTYWITRRYFGELTGLIAGLLILLYPTPMFYEFVLLRDAPLIFLGLVALLLTQRALEEPTAARLIIAGIAIGASLLMKSHFALFAVLALATIWTSLRMRPRRATLACLTLLAGILIGDAPLVVRNLAVGVSPFAAAANAGPTFIIANAGSSDYLIWKTTYVAPLMEEYGMSLPRLALATLGTQTPGGFARLILEKLAATLYWFEEHNNVSFQYAQRFSAVLASMPVSFGILAPLGIVGAFLALRRGSRLSLLYAHLIMALAVLLLFFVFDRFRIQLAYALAPFAANSVVQLLDFGLQRRWSRFTATLLPIAVISLHSLSPLAPDEVPIRRDDYGISHDLFFDVRARSEARRGNWSGAAGVIREEIELQPPFVRQMSPQHPPLNVAQADVAQLFAGFYGEYANLLAEAGQQDVAQAAASRAEQLIRVVSRFRASTQPASSP